MKKVDADEVELLQTQALSIAVSGEFLKDKTALVFDGAFHVDVGSGGCHIEVWEGQGWYELWICLLWMCGIGQVLIMSYLKLPNTTCGEMWPKF